MDEAEKKSTAQFEKWWAKLVKRGGVWTATDKMIAKSSWYAARSIP